IFVAGGLASLYHIQLVDITNTLQCYLGDSFCSLNAAPILPNPTSTSSHSGHSNMCNSIPLAKALAGCLLLTFLAQLSLVEVVGSPRGATNKRPRSSTPSGSV